MSVNPPGRFIEQGNYIIIVQKTSTLCKNLSSAIQPTSTSLNDAGTLSILNQVLNVIDKISFLVKIIVIAQEVLYPFQI